MNNLSWQEIPAEVLDQAVAQTFQMLVEVDASFAAAPEQMHADDVSMAVYCADAQQRALIVRCSGALATLLTGRMLEIPNQNLTAAEVVDAVGEIVNVIAGSVRGLFADPGGMSLPFAVTLNELRALTCFDRRSYSIGQHLLTLYRV